MTARRALALGLALSLASCTRVGDPLGSPVPPGPLPEDAAGAPAPETYAGIVAFGGRRVTVALELRSAGGGRLDGLLIIPSMEMEARGSGRSGDSGVVLELAYDGDCPGVVRVRASWEGEGRGRLTGSLSADDCTGRAEGTVALERRPAVPTRAGPPTAR